MTVIGAILLAIAAGPTAFWLLTAFSLNRWEKWRNHRRIKQRQRQS